MKHVHESLPTQGKPKFICRIHRAGKQVFFETFYYTEENKEEQRLAAKKAVRDYLESRNELHLLEKGTCYKSFHTKVPDNHKFNQVGVTFSAETSKHYNTYQAGICVKGVRVNISYSANYFGDKLAEDLAKRTAKCLRLYFKTQDHKWTDEHVEMLGDYVIFKKIHGRSRKSSAKKIAAAKIAEQFKRFERYCNSYETNL